jgi:hypothetical protein
MWLIVTPVIGFILFVFVSLVSRTSFTNIFNEFEVLLMLTGFTTMLSTMLTCTKFINDRISGSGR